MYQVIPWHKKVSGWDEAAFAQPPESLEIIRWYLDERASSTQYKFYRRLKA